MEKKNNDWNELIQNSRDYAAKRFETLLVYIASGGLIISIGFVNDIISIAGKNLTLLKTSWILFASTIFLNLISQLSSIKAMDQELDEKTKSSDLWDKSTRIINFLSVISLFLGILAFILFISNNM
jgi:hypothetical protein